MIVLILRSHASKQAEKKQTKQTKFKILNVIKKNCTHVSYNSLDNLYLLFMNSKSRFDHPLPFKECTYFCGVHDFKELLNHLRRAILYYLVSRTIET